MSHLPHRREGARPAYLQSGRAPQGRDSEKVTKTVRGKSVREREREREWEREWEREGERGRERDILYIYIYIHIYRYIDI